MSRRRDKKRPQKGETHRPRLGARRWRRAAGILIAVVLVGGLLAGGLLFQNLASGGDGPRTAAIVDQLSLTQPNPDFAEKTTTLLEQAGYTVDYFPGEQVTVDFYRNLPTRSYDLVVLRVHSGIVEERDAASGQETKTEYVSLFTGEPYSEDRYSEEQVNRLGRGEYYPGAAPLFAISPDFVKESMRGRFDKTLVILMGCDGLRSERTGQAFLDKGASAFVSWSRAVSASHSDAATLRLLEKLLVDGLGVGDAVRQTAAEVGRDPEYGAELRALPEED